MALAFRPCCTLTLAAVAMAATVHAADPRGADSTVPPRNAAANLEAPGSDIAGWVRDLHSPTFKTRDLATTSLMRLPPQRLEEVVAALQKESDDEASARLLRVAVHLFLRAQTPLQGEVGMLGIALAIETVHLPGRVDVSGAVAVTEVQPGFPAEEYLKTGDRLVAINGEAFPEDQEVASFRDRVNTTPPGSLVRFSVVRDGRLMNISVPLAGLPLNMPLVNFVDNRRMASQVFLQEHPVHTGVAPLVLPDPEPIGNDIHIQIVPAGDFIVPGEVITR
jgi:hypothetical protein